MAQSINLDGIIMFPWVRFVRTSLAVPHFFVRDISKMDPRKLKDAGFKGCIFDKDNTLTAPYVNTLFPTIRSAFEEYREVFRSEIVIDSNSAGTKDDVNYQSALRIEKELGIEVLRHDRKKPGGREAIYERFTCDPSYLVMFGDRPSTDIVFGNRYGMLTVMTTHFTEDGDNKAAAMMRRYEVALIRTWMKKGKMPPPHPLYNPHLCLERLL